MRVAIASDIELGSLRAHAINVVKTAGGFARLGHQAMVLLRAGGGDGIGAYGESDLAVELALPARGEPHSAPRQREFAAWAAGRAAAWGADVLYARHFEAALAGCAAGLRTVLETHAYVGDTNPALERCLRATGEGLAIVTISRMLREHYIARGAAAERVSVVADGVDLEMFTPGEVLGESPFPRDHRTHAVYAGHLYDYKGIPTVIEAAALAPDVGFELVGGTQEDCARARERASGLANVRVHGMRPYAEVPRWLWHADVLLLPPSAREASAAWTSPVKLGEYLASGPPVVASRIPGLTAWVDEPAVRWFEPDEARDLALVVAEAAGESAADASIRRAAARRYAERFSYPNRARRILTAATQRASAGAAS